MSKLNARDVQIPDEMWMELGLQAAVEGKLGRGDIIRKACRAYLDTTRSQRIATVSRAGAPE